MHVFEGEMAVVVRCLLLILARSTCLLKRIVVAECSGSSPAACSWTRMSAAAALLTINGTNADFMIGSTRVAAVARGG
jgi:hypothetical protein